MYLVVGLGNPGPKYAGTRHNVGFAVLDELAHRARVSSFASKFKGESATGQLGGERCALLKPLTYMNVSGESVQPAAAFYKIEPEHVIVVHDELDLPLGEIKMKKGGGHGGHNGIRSIAQMLGTPDFVRVRAGIGRPPGKRDVSNYVLGQFSADQKDDADLLIQKAADAMELVIKEGLLAAQNRFHTKKKKTPKVKKPRPAPGEGAKSKQADAADPNAAAPNAAAPNAAAPNDTAPNDTASNDTASNDTASNAAASTAPPSEGGA